MFQCHDSCRDHAQRNSLTEKLSALTASAAAMTKELEESKRSAQEDKKVCFVCSLCLCFAFFCFAYLCFCCAACLRFAFIVVSFYHWRRFCLFVR